MRRIVAFNSFVCSSTIRDAALSGGHVYFRPARSIILASFEFLISAERLNRRSMFPLLPRQLIFEIACQLTYIGRVAETL